MCECDNDKAKGGEVIKSDNFIDVIGISPLKSEGGFVLSSDMERNIIAAVSFWRGKAEKVYDRTVGTEIQVLSQTCLDCRAGSGSHASEASFVASHLKRSDVRRKRHSLATPRIGSDRPTA